MRTVVVLAVLAVAAPAAAGPVTVVSGGSSDELVASLGKVRGQMAVCWQRKPPATIKIALTVATSGEVSKATAKTKGAAAQCAAGILAVSTLAVEKAWKGVIAIEPAAAGKGEDVRIIEEALAAHSKDFYACQSKASSFAGKVTVKLEVGADGAVTGATADAESAAGKDVAKCVAATAKKLDLGELSGSLTYQLSLAFAGGDSGGGAAAEADPTLQPSKKGPLAEDDLMPEIASHKAAIGKCARASKARGRVVVRIAISAEGKVSAAKIKSSELDDAKAEACLVKVFQGMSFRESSDETVVLFPIRFDDDGVKTAS